MWIKTLLISLIGRTFDEELTTLVQYHIMEHNIFGNLTVRNASAQGKGIIIRITKCLVIYHIY